MFTVADAIARCADRLQNAGVESAALDARVLTAFSLGVSRTDLVRIERNEIPHDWYMLLRALVEQRCRNAPIAYLTGKKEFYGRDFGVTPLVLIPRPETELLIELTLRLWPASKANVLDLCTGSGCIAITLKAERPMWQVSAIDISDDALSIARSNATQLGSEVTWYCGDLFEPLSGEPASMFDIIVSNPPYLHTEQWQTSPTIQAEPRLALDGGVDGMDILNRLIPQARAHLNSDGLLMVEIDPSLAESVVRGFETAGYGDVRVHNDLAGHARVVVGRRTDP